MNKTTNNLIIFSLGMLVISSFLLITKPQKVSADFNGYGYQSGGTSNNGNYNNYSTSSNQTNPMPMVYSVTPNSIELNTIAGNIAVVLNGYNFVQGSMAEFNSSYRPTTYSSSNQLTVILSASDLATAGSNVITVFNPMPGGGNSNGVFFTIKAQVLSQNTNQNPVIPVTTNANQNTSIIPLANIDNNQNTPDISTPITSPIKSTKTKAAAVSNPGENLSASALFGANSFLPSTLTQWLLLLVLVILIVIFTRKAFVAEEKKHMPTKHA